MALRRRPSAGGPAGFFPDPGSAESLPDRLLALRHVNAFRPAGLSHGVQCAAPAAHPPHGTQDTGNLARAAVPDRRILWRGLLGAAGRHAGAGCAARTHRRVAVGEGPAAHEGAAPAGLDTGRRAAGPGRDEVFPGEFVPAGHGAAGPGVLPLQDGPLSGAVHQGLLSIRCRCRRSYPLPSWLYCSTACSRARPPYRPGKGGCCS